MRKLAVPVVPMVRAVRAGAVRAVLATTSMWQRGGCNNVAVTSTWLGAVAGAGAAGPARPVRGRAGLGRVRCRGAAGATGAERSLMSIVALPFTAEIEISGFVPPYRFLWAVR